MKISTPTMFRPITIIIGLSYNKLIMIVTNKGWQEEPFKNILKIVLKAASGLFKCTFSIFVGFMSFEITFAPFFPKVRLNAPENVKWCNHKRMTNITYLIHLQCI